MPKRAHVILLPISLHWLPVEAHIKFKLLVLAYITATCSTPSHLNSLRIVYIPISLRSVNERWLMVPLQRSTISLSRTFSFTIPCWWNDLPNSMQSPDSQIPHNLQETTENSSFPWAFNCILLKNVYKKLYFFNFSVLLLSLSLPLLAFTTLNDDWNLI